MSLNLRQLEVFRAVMTAGSVSGASQLLLISQPAVSRMLSHTEQRVGFLLFERIKGRLYPTPEARRLFHDVEHVYRDLQRVNATLLDLVQQRHGVVRVVCSPSLGHHLLPGAICAFRRDHPDTRVSLECLRHVLLRDRLLDQQADFGVSLFPITHPNIEAIPLYTLRMALVYPQQWPVSEQAPSAQAALAPFADRPLVGYPAGTPFATLAQRLSERAGIDYRPAIEVDSPHHACALVREGAGWALVDEFSLALATAFSPVRVRPLDEHLTVNLVHLRREPLSQQAQSLVERLREAFARLHTHNSGLSDSGE